MWDSPPKPHCKRTDTVLCQCGVLLDSILWNTDRLGIKAQTLSTAANSPLGSPEMSIRATLKNLILENTRGCEG